MDKPKGKLRVVKERPVKESDLEPRHPWDKQPTESQEAFHAFAVYRDMGPDRKMREVGKQLERPYASICKWASPGKHNWTARATAWDVHHDRLIQTEFARETKRMAKRHADNAAAALAAAMSTIMLYVKSPRNPKPKQLDSKDAIRLFEVAMKMERQARGEPDAITETRQVMTVDAKRAELQKVLSSPEARDAARVLTETIEGEATTDGGGSVH